MKYNRSLYCLLFLFAGSLYTKRDATKAPSHTIMLAPAGDAQKPGRIIDTVYERGIALQCAQALHDYIQKKAPFISVLVSRSAGETVTHLESASVANRLPVSLYVALSFYHEKQVRPRLYLYRYASTNDFLSPRTTQCTPYQQAHLLNKEKNDHTIIAMHNELHVQSSAHYIDFLGPYGLPLQTLIGISTPACMLECGLKQRTSWQDLIEPLGDACIAAVQGDT